MIFLTEYIELDIFTTTPLRYDGPKIKAESREEAQIKAWKVNPRLKVIGILYGKKKA